MLIALESLYCVLFVIAALQGTRVAISLGQPRWLMVIGTVSYALGTAGMLLHLSGEVSPGLANAWRFVVGGILGHLILELVFEWRSGLFQRLGQLGEGRAASGRATDEESEGQARSLALTGTALAVLFALPMLRMNVQVAFGG